jgi:hypothetical protein
MCLSDCPAVVLSPLTGIAGPAPDEPGSRSGTRSSSVVSATGYKLHIGLSVGRGNVSALDTALAVITALAQQTAP